MFSKFINIIETSFHAAYVEMNLRKLRYQIILQFMAIGSA